MSNIYLTGCALAISILISVIFISKERIENIETKIFGYMLSINICEAFFTTMIVIIAITINSTSILSLLNRLDVIAIIAWCSLMFYYICSISYNRPSKLIKWFIIVFDIVLCVLALILDVAIINTDGILNSTGPLTDLGLASASFYIIAMIFVLFTKNKEKAKFSGIKYIPLYFLIILITVIAFLRVIIPEINFISILLSFVALIMYFTIENPDLKMINELNMAREQADRANMAKTEFLSSMSHEIRTPLNAIVGFSEALKEEDLSLVAQEEVEDIITASQNLLEIVNGILDISKIEANKLEIVNTEYSMDKVLAETVALIKTRIKDDRVKFTYHFDSNLPPILYGDHIRIKQILVNLLTNSVKYTKEGLIDFSVSSVNKGDVCRLIMAVKDTGIGIKKHNINKLFYKFERFDVEENPTIEGTGLGLAITKKLIDLMDGQIVVQSDYGKGSRFTVAIDQKIVPKVVTVADTNYTFNGPFDCGGKKILLVDDNKLNLKVATRLLQNYKVDIEELMSGQECLDKILSGNKYDLILLDDMMPKMSGVETFAKLKEIPNFSIPVVILTANAISGMKEKYMRDGFDYYLSKPIERDELNKVIKMFLRDKKV